MIKSNMKSNFKFMLTEAKLTIMLMWLLFKLYEANAPSNQGQQFHHYIVKNKIDIDLWNNFVSCPWII